MVYLLLFVIVLGGILYFINELKVIRVKDDLLTANAKLKLAEEKIAKLMAKHRH
jgi:hypothetical protein